MNKQDIKGTKKHIESQYVSLANNNPPKCLFHSLLIQMRDIKEFIWDSQYILIIRVKKSFSQKSDLNYGNHTAVKYYDFNKYG